MGKITDLRPSPIAGLWYPGEAERLSRVVDEYIQAACLPDLSGEVVAVISPHAGYIYSGRTAGYAFRTVLGSEFDLVAVLSPMHGFYPAPLITSAHPSYATPLGALEVDREAMQALDSALQTGGHPGIASLANDEEHSLEIELPFLQRALKGTFKLLPLMLRSFDDGLLRALGGMLGKILTGRRALMVASSDLSHFYPEAKANELDAHLLAQVEALSPEGVLEAERTGAGQACGSPAIAAVLWAAQALGATQVKVLHHSTSADQTGDKNSVVGYGAAVVLKT